MKIAMVCYPSIGGSGLIATELGVQLARQGHELHFISYAPPFKLPRYERNIYFHAVDLINYPLFKQTLYTFSLTAKIIEVVNDYHLDIVHAHYSIPHSLCVHLAREISGKPFKMITTLHGTDISIVGQDKPLYPINKYGIEQSDRVTTVSRFQKELTKKYFDIRQEIDLIYNFIDTDVFTSKTEIDRSYLANSDQKVIMHISNFRTVKNPHGLINAFRYVHKAIPTAVLILVGCGPELRTIKRLCKQFDLCNHIRFLGNVAKIESLIPLADCVFQPSYKESFGMSLLEAMACAVPTVSSDVEGIPELVIHDETGFMSPPDAHQELADFIIELCRSPELAKRMGKKGRQRAIEQFDQRLIIPQYDRCYEELASI